MKDPKVLEVILKTYGIDKMWIDFINPFGESPNRSCHVTLYRKDDGTGEELLSGAVNEVYRYFYPKLKDNPMAIAKIPMTVTGFSDKRFGFPEMYDKFTRGYDLLYSKETGFIMHEEFKLTREEIDIHRNRILNALLKYKDTKCPEFLILYFIWLYELLEIISVNNAGWKRSWNRVIDRFSDTELLLELLKLRNKLIQCCYAISNIEVIQFYDKYSDKLKALMQEAGLDLMIMTAYECIPEAFKKEHSNMEPVELVDFFIHKE